MKLTLLNVVLSVPLLLNVNSARSASRADQYVTKEEFFARKIRGQASSECRDWQRRAKSGTGMGVYVDSSYCPDHEEMVWLRGEWYYSVRGKVTLASLTSWSKVTEIRAGFIVPADKEEDFVTAQCEKWIKKTLELNRKVGTLGSIRYITCNATKSVYDGNGRLSTQIGGVVGVDDKGYGSWAGWDSSTHKPKPDMKTSPYLQETNLKDFYEWDFWEAGNVTLSKCENWALRQSGAVFVDCAGADSTPDNYGYYSMRTIGRAWKTGYSW